MGISCEAAAGMSFACRSKKKNRPLFFSPVNRQLLPATLSLCPVNPTSGRRVLPLPEKGADVDPLNGAKRAAKSAGPEGGAKRDPLNGLRTAHDIQPSKLHRQDCWLKEP